MEQEKPTSAESTQDENIPTRQIPAMTPELLAMLSGAGQTGGDDTDTKPDGASISGGVADQDDVTTVINPVVVAPAAVAAVPPAKTSEPADTVDDLLAAASAKTPRGPRKRRNRLVIALVVIVVLLVAAAAAVFGLGKYYEGKAKIGASVAGIDVAGQTQEELVATINNLWSKATFTVDDGTQRVNLTADELGATLDPQKTAEAVLGSPSGLRRWWPFQGPKVPLSISVSDETLQKALDDALIADASAPHDASVTLDSDSQKFVASPASAGEAIDVAPVRQALDDLAQTGVAVTVTVTSAPADPVISTAAATKAADVANAALKQKYTFTAGSKSYTLPAKQIREWLTFTADPEAGTLAAGADPATVAAELPGILNKELASETVPKRVLDVGSSAGMGAHQITIQQGEDGTTLDADDLKSAASQMVEAIGAGRPLTFDMAVTKQDYETEHVKPDTPGLFNYDVPHGSKWIDVDLSTFTVKWYEGTTLIGSTLCVPGATATPSRQGTFYVYLRYRYQDMSGEGYDPLPNVPSVMYYDGGQALHGAYWRSSFGYGGANGSHGCINLPVSKAKQIFDWSSLGTKVVVHQ